jgi:hypothetical protein
MVNSKAKGGAAEREVIKLFNTMLGGGFSRQPNQKNGHDVIAPDNFPYATEVKDNRGLKTRHFINPNKLLQDFWKQTCKNAKAIDKTPQLVCKVEGVWFCVMEIVHSDMNYPLIEFELNGTAVAATKLEGWVKYYKRRLNEYRRENNSAENF